MSQNLKRYKLLKYCLLTSILLSLLKFFSINQQVKHSQFRKVSSCILTNGNEFILGFKKQKSPNESKEDKILYVSSALGY